MSRYIENQNKLKIKENKIYIPKSNIVLERSKEEREFIEISSVKSDDNSIDLINFIECLDNSKTKRYGDICKMLIQGYNQNEIAETLELSRDRINKKISKIREIITEEYLKCS